MPTDVSFDLIDSIVIKTNRMIFLRKMEQVEIMLPKPRHVVKIINSKTPWRKITCPKNNSNKIMKRGWMGSTTQCGRLR